MLLTLSCRMPAPARSIMVLVSAFHLRCSMHTDAIGIVPRRVCASSGSFVWFLNLHQDLQCILASPAERLKMHQNSLLLFRCTCWCHPDRNIPQWNSGCSICGC